MHVVHRYAQAKQPYTQNKTEICFKIMKANQEGTSEREEGGLGWIIGVEDMNISKL